MKLSRRSILKGLLAAPAIIRTPGLLMSIRPLRVVAPLTGTIPLDNSWWNNPGGDGSFYKSQFAGKYYWEVTLAPTLKQLESAWQDFNAATVASIPVTPRLYAPPGFMKLLRADDVYPDLIQMKITET